MIDLDLVGERDMLRKMLASADADRDRLRLTLSRIADAGCECNGPGDGCSACVGRLANIAREALKR